MQAAARPKRRSWLIAAPLAVFVLLSAAWTVGWFVIKREVERGFDAWLAAEANAGRAHTCPNRAFGGYPFRIDISCTDPVLQVQTPEGPVRARMSGATVAALIYRPQHVVVDLKAPLIIEQNGAQLAAVEFQKGQASYRTQDNAFERFSLVLERVAAGRSNGRPELTAEQIEVHTRHTPTVQPHIRDFDMALTARRLAPPGVRPEQGADLTTQGTVRGWPIARPATADGPVAEWARGGGTVELQGLRVTRGNGLLAANGRLGFNSNGRADGQFRASVADTPALFSGLAIPGIGDTGALLGPILALVGRPGEVEGRRGTEVQLRVDNGALSIGAVQIAVFPPVF